MVCRRVRRSFVFSAAAALIVATPSVFAQSPPGAVGVDQDWTDEIPAYLAIVDGDVTLERDGRLERAEPNLALLAGDRLDTRRGRVEVLFSDGSVLDLDTSTTVDFLSESLLRLLDGRVRLSIPRTTLDLAYRIDTPAASALIRTAGEYRVSATADRRAVPETELTVWRGSAELSNAYGRTIVRPGTYAVADTQSAPSLPYVANSAAYDDFDRWAEAQRADRLGAESVRYLPAEIRYESGVFDRYGSWGYEAPYGYVWYPRVTTGWRPYYDGRWSFVGRFGWFWIGVDRWSWPTHHYGRWGVSAGRWFWIPGNRWSPAWVTWAVAPGYVGWCPLGYDNRAVFGFGFGSRYVDGWAAWTVLPTRHFVTNVVVRQHVVVHTSIAPAVRGQFVEYRTPPRGAATAAQRRVDPVRAPTGSRGVAIPRSAVTLPEAPAASAPATRSLSGPSAAVAPRAGSEPERAAPSRVTRPSNDARRIGVPSAATREVAPRAEPPAAAGPSRAWPRTSSADRSPVDLSPRVQRAQPPSAPAVGPPPAAVDAPRGWGAARRAPVPDAAPPPASSVRPSAPAPSRPSGDPPSRSRSSVQPPTSSSRSSSPPARVQPPPASSSGSAKAVPRRGRGGTY